jgi:hypothetical protein
LFFSSPSPSLCCFFLCVCSSRPPVLPSLFSSFVFSPSVFPPLVHLLCSIFIGKRTPLHLLEWSCSRWDSIY